MIKVEGVTKSFGRQLVLRGVDLEVPDGSITVIIGRSGGGKTVFLRHMIGLLRPDRGRILLDGVDLTQLRGRDLDRVRDRYGVVFQGGALFDSLTCAENVAFPLREKTGLHRAEIADRVATNLTRVGLGDVAGKDPADVLGRMPNPLAMAGAHLPRAPIEFFDEPTTGLDS